MRGLGGVKDSWFLKNNIGLGVIFREKYASSFENNA